MLFFGYLQDYILIYEPNCYREIIVISNDDDDEDHAEFEGLEVPRQPSTQEIRSGSSSFDVIPASQPETPR